MKWRRKSETAATKDYSTLKYFENYAVHAILIIVDCYNVYTSLFLSS